VPPFDFLFTELPAEKYNAAVPKMRKVAKTHLEVFHKYTQFLDGLEIGADLLQARNIERTDRASPSILSLSAGLPNIVFRSSQDGLGLSDRHQSGIQVGYQVIGFRQGKEPVMFLIVAMGHEELQDTEVRPKYYGSFSTPVWTPATEGGRGQSFHWRTLRQEREMA
jgi:hypothetical protein